MIEALKDQAAKLVISRKFKKPEFVERDFTSIFDKSFSFLVLMPKDERDFHYAINILNFLRENKKTVTIVTYDFRVSLLPPAFKPNVIEHGINDISKINLPSKKLIDRIEKIRYDVVIDANREEVVFYNFITRHVNAKIHFGFMRENSDKYFNLQIINNESSPEISYRNLLNCLKML